MGLFIIVLLGAGIFLYIKWENTQTELDLTKTSLEETGKEYNQAKVQFEKEKIKIDALDKKLQESIGRAKAIEQLVIKWANNSTGGGQANKQVYNTTINEYSTPASQVPEDLTYYAKYNYKDFRIDITADSKEELITYKLSQLMNLKIYKLSDFDYRAEIIEYNKDTSEPVQVFPIESFDIRKVVLDKNKVNFGFNLTVGANAALNSTFKFKPGANLGMNFISYGQTHLQSKFRFVTINAGTNGAFITPFSYNLHDMLKIFNDLYIDIPMVGIEYQKGISPIVGIGLSSTL